MGSCASNSGKSAVGPAAHRLTLSSRPSSTSYFPSAFNTSFASLGEYVAPATVSFCPTNRTRRFSPACLELLVAHLVCPRTSPCSFRSPVAAMCQRHIGPCTKCILSSLMHCSCKKCLPMLNSLLYALMHAWVCRLSSSCTFSNCSFVPFSLRCSTVRRICMARFQSRVLFGVLAAVAPISLGPLSFLVPRNVCRHVLLS